MSKCKFRISVSLEQMRYIISCPDCPPDLRKQLDLAIMKASHGYTVPAYEVKTSTKQLSLDQAYRIACRTLEGGGELHGEMLKQYNEYRYQNDLMSDEESEQYENAVFEGEANGSSF